MKQQPLSWRGAKRGFARDGHYFCLLPDVYAKRWRVTLDGTWTNPQLFRILADELEKRNANFKQSLVQFQAYVDANKRRHA